MAHDLYETLQVHPRADREAISAAYQRLRALYDPARLEGAADELVELARQKRDAIEHAYAVLSDPTRRRAYDADLAAAPVAVAEDDAPEAGDTSAFDYRPLPPAGRTERPRGFEAQPVRRSAGRRTMNARSWQVPAIIAAVLIVLIAPVSLAVTQLGGPPPAAPAPTASPLDQFEPFIAQAKQNAEQNPKDARAWVDYGNMLYDSAIIAREQDANGALYQQRLPRWLQATEAYSKALELDPGNASVRADMGASYCFYGSGTGDQDIARKGLDTVRQAAQAAPKDTRVLLNLGNCLVSVQPPQTDEALKSWKRIIEIAPDTDQTAGQARQLIARYEQK